MKTATSKHHGNLSPPRKVSAAVSSSSAAVSSSSSGLPSLFQRSGSPTGGGAGKGNHSSNSAAATAAAALALSTAVDMSKVRLNENGGVLVTKEELVSAFSMLDSEKYGFVTLNTLKKRLGVFFPEMSSKEYRFLMNNRKEMSLEDLEELLLDNEIGNFDPVAEAFKVCSLTHSTHSYLNPFLVFLYF